MNRWYRSFAPSGARALSLKRVAPLFLILAVSFAIRLLAFIHWGAGPIESEGAEYARIAENLRNGVGYVGIVTPGPELMFPPLFPLLIAAASFLTDNYTMAGRLVSLVFGTLLPLPAFGIAWRLFGGPVAIVTAMLFILHPLFVSLSVTVLTEGPYATVLLFAVYLVLCAKDKPSLLMWSFVGMVFGISYLLRPEAFAPFAIAGVLALTSTEGTWLSRSQRAGIAVLTFFLAASPEIIYLYRVTGQLRLEGKSAINSPLAVFTLNRQEGTESRSTPMPESEAMKWASTAIGPDLRRIGIWMRPEDEVARDCRLSAKDLSRIVKKAIPQNTSVLLAILNSKWMGAPFLPALAMLGAFRRPWRRSVIAGRLYLVLVPMTAILASFAVLWPFSRFYFILLPFLLFWGANGLVEIGQFTKGFLTTAGLPWFARSAGAFLVPSDLQ